MDEDVVENYRARGNSGYVIFNCSQTKNEVKLVARAIAQSSYFKLFLVLPNGNEDRLIVISETSRKAVVFAQSESGKSSLARVRTGPWCFSFKASISGA